MLYLGGSVVMLHPWENVRIVTPGRLRPRLLTEYVSKKYWSQKQFPLLATAGPRWSEMSDSEEDEIRTTLLLPTSSAATSLAVAEPVPKKLRFAEDAAATGPDSAATGPVPDIEAEDEDF